MLSLIDFNFRTMSRLITLFFFCSFTDSFAVSSLDESDSLLARFLSSLPRPYRAVIPGISDNAAPLIPFPNPTTESLTDS